MWTVTESLSAAAAQHGDSKVVAVKLDLLSPGVEVGLVTTNRDEMASDYDVVEPLTEFAPMPGMGWMFVADPDGNWIELCGTL